MIVRKILTCLLLYFFANAMGAFTLEAQAEEDDNIQAYLTAPNLRLPTDGLTTTGVTYPPFGVPTFSWSPIIGADKYGIEISTSAGFADPIVEKTTYLTTYTPEFALSDGEYYWRVKGGSGFTWGEFSEVRTFNKMWDAEGTILPQLITPVDGSVHATFKHDGFSWTSMRGAAGYLLDIATDQSFSTILYSASTTTTFHTPPKHLNNNVYYWRVTPYDNQNNFSTPSEIFSFTFDWKMVPHLLAPEDDTVLIYSPTLSWTAVEGAKEYILEIDTEDDFPSPAFCTCYTTNFTWYKNLSNDQEYFWRVKAIDNAGNSGPWSAVNRFQIKWEFEPELLAPNNNVIHQAAPFFSWEPIPGAERYQFQIDESTSFENPKTDIEIYNATRAGITRIKDTETDVNRDYYWRVRGIDAQNNYTPWTEIHAFRFGWETSPNLVYPQIYYEPDLENLPVARDETIANPLFIWNTAHKWEPYPYFAEGADFYELTAAADPAFLSIHFKVDTASLAAAPTLENPFTNLSDGDLVYWRVRAFVNSAQPSKIGADSTWVTRIDTKLDSPTGTLPVSDSSSPIYPADGFNSVDVPPVLGWLPIDGADHYQLQISRDATFNSLVEDVHPQFANYVPGLGHRNKMDYGTYWWRIRAQDGTNAATTDWSEPRHFHIAFELLNGNRNDVIPGAYPNTLLNDVELIEDDELTQLYRANWTKAGSDANDSLASGELTTLHVMLNRIDLRASDYPKSDDNYNWILAFAADLTTDDATYALYVDSDHIAGSGGTQDPYGINIVVEDLYLPEHVLYIRTAGNNVEPANIELFSWTGSAWTPGQALDAIGGDAWYAGVNQSPTERAIQLLIPYTALGPGEENWSGSVALSLFSIDSVASGNILDTLPNQGETLDSPVFVSDMLMPLYPFDMPHSDPIVFQEMPSLHWRMPPFGSIDGYELEIARDQQFTDIVETWEIKESQTGPYFAMLTTVFQSQNAYEDNESYYWRVRLRHERYSIFSTQYDYGPWSPAMRFRLTSRTVSNPQVSIGDPVDTTPYFTWGRVEGASGYRIEIDDDANFSDPEFKQNVDSTAYASIGAIWDGTWYWRVAARRSSKIRGEWMPTMSFTKRSIPPTPLSPINDTVINQQPTFQWTAILTPTNLPRVSAPSYRLEVDDDPNFSSPDVYKTDSTSFTLEPKKNLADGTWHWRVATVDAVGNVGAFSRGQKFYKEYVPPTVISPTQGESLSSFSEFKWDSVPGAAYYELEYADNSLFNLSKKITTDNTRYTPTDRFSAQEYYWRVRVYDDDRNAGPFVVGKVELKKNEILVPFTIH